MSNKHILYVFFTAFFSSLTLFSHSQETFPVNGPINPRHHHVAFTNANIVQSPTETLTDATLIIKGERIVDVGKNIEIPSKSVIIDIKGAWIYPSFIDLDSEYGMSGKQVKMKPDPHRRLRPPQLNSKTKGAFSWNQAIHPETNAAENFHKDEKVAMELRKMGIGAVLSHKHDGIMRGTSVLVNTGTEKDNLDIIEAHSAQHFSFRKGSSGQIYPTSLMGTIALIRQTLYDAQWYDSRAEKDEINLSLEALNERRDLPIIFEVRDHLSALRAKKIADEFELNIVVCGSGDEYRRVNEMQESGLNFIIPVQLPLPYDVTSAFDASDISLRKMKHWELAPFNARILDEHNIEFAFSAKGLKEKDFWSNIRKIRSSGIADSSLLAALTTVPAKFIGVQNTLGKLRKDYTANFLISSAPVFNDDAVLYENWVNGERYVINEELVDVRGEYNLNVNQNGGMLLVVEGSKNKPKGKVFKGKKEINATIGIKGKEISIRYNTGSAEAPNITVLTGNLSDDDSRIWVGKGNLSDGTWIDWAAIKQKDFVAVKKDSSGVDSIHVPSINYPLGAYGREAYPEQRNIIFKKATIWTNEDTGRLDVADICISGGKILAVGRGLNKSDYFNENDEVEIIDAEDKHITSGIIDEHSHIAIAHGVNEAGQASSAEVRIGDVVYSDDINIYRQLAGGVTASQLLHGSANPIGGQSGLIKMRWGLSPEEMKIENADGFIKFALGENVKQSNWGDLVRIRYPQTRMGVEQVFYDGFYRALDYEDSWKIYKTGMENKRRRDEGPIKPRVDLELEALAEILNKERFITCHSYVASEITMLMRVADSMNIRVNTFTHILEGYKVADKMREHGAGGSTFSDWWAYKYEVNDAIPYNASIMNEEGIVTAINSDDAEMGRRLNQEAAKSVKYGGTSQEDAWKMVSLNPAKLLHLDDRMGSLSPGKDADIVVWSANPLSINARAEMTFVDGRCLYSREEDNILRENIRAERARLIQLMLSEIKKNKKSQKVNKEQEPDYHCDTEIDYGQW